MTNESLDEYLIPVYVKSSLDQGRNMQHNIIYEAMQLSISNKMVFWYFGSLFLCPYNVDYIRYVILLCIKYAFCSKQIF